MKRRTPDEERKQLREYLNHRGALANWVTGGPFAPAMQKEQQADFTRLAKKYKWDW